MLSVISTSHCFENVVSREVNRLTMQTLSRAEVIRSSSSGLVWWRRSFADMAHFSGRDDPDSAEAFVRIAPLLG
jgi:hypothetical protein